MAKKKISPTEQYTLFYVILTVLIGIVMGYIYGGFMVARESNGYVSDPVENGNSTSEENTINKNPQSLDDLVEVEVSTDDDPALGIENDATITIVEFSDYQCPFCKDFFDESLPLLKQEYIDTGKVVYVFRDFPLEAHPQAPAAATAANCAGEQNHYWDMHDQLFEHQDDWSFHDNAEEIFLQYAKQLDLNMEEFTTCLKDETQKQAIEIGNDQSDGSSYGVQSTPTFFINGKKVLGAQPAATFRTVIERELAAKMLETR